jgi:hypothetical protein
MSLLARPPVHTALHVQRLLDALQHVVGARLVAIVYPPGAPGPGVLNVAVAVSAGSLQVK